MNKKLLLAGAFVSLWGTAVLAQTPVALDRKWNGAVEHLFQQEQQNLAKGLKAISNETKGFVISCTDAEVVAEAIRLEGYEATIIGNNIISANLPLNYVRELVEMEEVLYVNGSRQFRPTMNTSRKVTGAYKVQEGVELETPFTGKGVIVGVIDQGFEYKHIAFLDKDKKSRVRAVWNHYKGLNATTSIPSTGDGISGTSGHATHVTNIAAGSKVEGNNYYGIAPDAEIIMVASNFNESDVLEEAKYISEFAKNEGKPFVINMSFGSQIGPHDGSDDYCTGMNAIAEKGGVLVAAMGNEGGMKLHGHHVFTKENEKIYLIVKSGNGVNLNYLDIWGQNADGEQHLKVTPIVFHQTRKTKTPKEDSFWRSCAKTNANIAPYNQKENYSFEVNVQAMRSLIKEGATNMYHFGVEITGNPGDEFHAWTNPGWGEIYKAPGLGYVTGDNEYCVGEGAAIIPHAVAVASFDGNNGDFTSTDGNTYSFPASEGSVSTFSSRGPSLGDAPKPLVAAPGHVVASAVSQYSMDKSENGKAQTVSVIRNGGKSYYYQVMSGTSMASPTVAGIVALWLEANPNLTYPDVKQIIEETSTLDIKIGTKEKWDAKRGYGKIDAYAGLKKALEMAESTGINDQLNSLAPITINKTGNQFNILFNNDESYATISLYNASGVEVKREQLNDIRRGNETIITTAGLPAGVYVIRINTTASSTAKKMMVK